MPATAPPETAKIACLEVWGGNRPIEARLSLPGLEGWVVSQPFHDEDAGGDVHFVSSCGTGRITRLLLADVSGHGSAVAALADRFRRLMQRYLNHIEPHALTRRMNRDMGRLAGGSGRFATALVMTFFAPDGTLSICNAGHPPPLLYRKRHRRWAAIDQPDAQERISNLPLGLLEEVGYHGRELIMEPGDIVLAYTDALTEAAHPEHGMLATAGLVDFLNACDIDPQTIQPNVLVEELVANLAQAGYLWEDDLTAIALRCVERSSGNALRHSVAAAGRMVRDLVRGSPFPLPEFSRRNLLPMLASKR